MIFNKYTRALASASLLALAFASAPAGLAHAGIHQTRESCELSGNFWDPKKGCADRQCQYDGVSYKHGQGVYVPKKGGGTARLECNGFTGHMEVVRTADPQGPLNPQAPRPTTNGR